MARSKFLQFTAELSIWCKEEVSMQANGDLGTPERLVFGSEEALKIVGDAVTSDHWEGLACSE
jgi:hypothetical protein